MAGVYGIFFFLVIVVSLGAIVGFIFYLLFLQNLLRQISPQNQKIQPGHVWMQMIPGYGLYYQFVIINKVAESLKAELEDKGIRCNEARPGFQLGLVMCILFCASMLPQIGSFIAIGAIVVWIIYWVKLNNFKKQLISGKSTYTFQDAEIIDDI